MSKPYITFHDVASIHFGPIRDFVKGDPCLTGEPFCTRRLVLTQRDGTTYHFALYADRVEQLQVGVDETIDRHQPAPLPVCAGDKPAPFFEPRVGDWFRMPLYNGEVADAVVKSCTINADGAADMELRTKSGERLAGVWSRTEQLALRRIPTPMLSDTGRAVFDEPRRGA